MVIYDSSGCLRIDSTRAATFTGVCAQAKEALTILAMRQYTLYEASQYSR